MKGSPRLVAVPDRSCEFRAMINSTTQKRLVVLTDGTAGPYLFLPEVQLDEVRRLLDKEKIRYEVDDYFISFDGGPETALINFGRRADAEAIQGILDGADERGRRVVALANQIRRFRQP